MPKKTEKFKGEVKESKKKKETKETKEKVSIAVASAPAECHDKKCPFHGYLRTRGRNFEGEIVKKTHKTVKVQWPRFKFYPKYERFAKAKSAVHAHLPACMSAVEEGMHVKISECRPISKTKHFVVTEIIKQKV